MSKADMETSINGIVNGVMELYVDRYPDGARQLEQLTANEKWLIGKVTGDAAIFAVGLAVAHPEWAQGMVDAYRGDEPPKADGRFDAIIEALAVRVGIDA